VISENEFDKKLKIECLYKNINRLDFYINTTNSKTAFILAFNSFIFGSILLKYSIILEKNFGTCELLKFPASIFLFFVMCSSLVSMYYAFMVVNPFLKSIPISSDYHSVIFFGDVSKFKDENEFLKKMENIDTDKLIEDLEKQFYILSKGLSIKFNNLKISIGFLMYGVVSSLGAILALKLLTIIP